MRRILVVDESETIRETLRLVLGRDFAVSQRPLISDQQLSIADGEADLLILGVPPEWDEEPQVVGRIVARTPCPILFLLDSRAAVDPWKGPERVDFLAKPFNPYDLREKVERLLARSSTGPDRSLIDPSGKERSAHYLDFPYLSKAASGLAKRYAVTSLPVLILGEKGCGQERVARAIHFLDEKAGPWISAYGGGLTKERLLERVERLSRRLHAAPQPITLFLGGLETIGPETQASLLEFLEEGEREGERFRIFSASQRDLLEKVYRGEFLGPLYYRLATLVLRLLPLRERRDDLESLVASVAREYGARLHLGPIAFSAEAMAILRNYLWFGNLDELEAVIARTLAIHRKVNIQAQDLVLGFEENDFFPPPGSEGRSEPRSETKPPSEPAEKEAGKPAAALSPPAGERKIPAAARAHNGDSPDIKILINELAHELKNPMVTIKTFAQLLGERFDDPTFRSRFQETVGGDIDRMDELLEAMLDFSRFTHPTAEKIPLSDQLRRVLEEIVPECIKRGVTIRWGRQGDAGDVFADEAQLRYAFKNILDAVLAQVKPKGEIQIDVEGEGRVALSYLPESGRIGSLAQYLDIAQPQFEVQEEAFPLRVILAKILLERNGGGIHISRLDGGRVLVRAELPVA